MIKREIIDEVIEKIEKQENRVAKRLVEIRFDNGMCLSYLSDIETIEVGDLVTVEGKLEDEVGVVKTVKKSFKTPKFDMRWVESILDRDVAGDYFKLGEDMVSTNSTLTAEKFITMYAGLKYKDNQAVGEDEIELDLADFEDNELFDNEIVKIKGKELFKANAVAFISLKDGIGKAIVRGGDWYEIDFRCKAGRITYIACDCPYFGECKHEIAFLYKLRDFWKKFTKKTDSENFVMCRKECFNTILSSGKGKVSIDL